MCIAVQQGCWHYKSAQHWDIAKKEFNPTLLLYKNGQKQFDSSVGT
jgi:hypothetical protein